MDTAEEYAGIDAELFNSRQLNSQPVRRRLVLDDDSEADTPADTAADITARTSERPSVEDTSVQPLADGAAAGTATVTAAGGALPGDGRGAADAPIAVLAAQSAAGVQAALQRARTGATPPSGRGRSAAQAGSGDMDPSSRSVMRQQGIMSYFSPKKAST